MLRLGMRSSTLRDGCVSAHTEWPWRFIGKGAWCLISWIERPLDHKKSKHYRLGWDRESEGFPSRREDAKGYWL